jgi:phage shock protein C
MAEKNPKKTRRESRSKRRSLRKKETHIERQTRHFGEEVALIGKHLEIKLDHKGDEWESWFRRTFGLVGPLLSSVLGLIFIGIGIWALGFVNIPVGSTFISGVETFFRTNLALFFMIFLFFSYTSYFSKAWPRAYWPFSPIVTAAGISISVWVAAQVVLMANASLGIGFIGNAAGSAISNINLIFILILLLAFIVHMARHPRHAWIERREIMPAKKSKPGPSRTAAPASTDRVKRLYRSGNDRILGGVCGGIAEYLEVDPVIIRLIWIVGSLIYGAGVIAYIIAWIIIPRNPKHKWG